MNRYQTVKPEQKYTAKMFDREFPSEDACLQYVFERRFPAGIALCVNCQSGTETLPRLRPHLLRLPCLREPPLSAGRHHLP